MIKLPYSETEFGKVRKVVWVGGSKEDLSRMPQPVKSSFGLELYRLQMGVLPKDAKALTQFGGGVYELREAFNTDAFRLVYVTKLENGIYVLHVFMKKSTSGIGLPTKDIAKIENRLRSAKIMDRGEQ